MFLNVEGQRPIFGARSQGKEAPASGLYSGIAMPLLARCRQVTEPDNPHFPIAAELSLALAQLALAGRPAWVKFDLMNFRMRKHRAKNRC